MSALAQVLRPLSELFRPEDHPRLLVGLAGPDDAAVYRISDDLAIVQTVDFFPPVVDDPYVFGAVAAANAMSDVYAMGGEVALALNLAAFPDDLPIEILGEILRGGAEKVAEAGGVIAGGHTLYDKEPKYGLSVMGTVHPDRVFTKAGARSGDALLLTKPLGTGIILTAAREDACAPDHLQAAVDSMLRLNRHDAHLARQFEAHAVTDVTGFGLLGHAAEMARAAALAYVIEASAAPLLPGALAYARRGFIPGGSSRNREGLRGVVETAADVPPDLLDLLYDPQTSGGLLIALAADVADAAIAAFRAAGLECRRIGRVEAGAGVRVVA